MPTFRRLDPNKLIEVKIDRTLAKTLTEIPIRRVKPSPDQFKEALTRLAEDSGYRKDAMKNPGQILEDFNLTLKELSALRTVASMSGADLKAVDHLTATSISLRADSVASAADWDVSCCSCCCCCCGETAAAPGI